MDEKKEYMEKFWHTTAHVFANALVETFPTAKIAIGPAIENGFHYDFELDKNIDAKDLEVLEKKMNEVLKRREKMIQKDISVLEALEMFKDNCYKVEMINDLAKEGAKTISTYRNGAFTDMCIGPPVSYTHLTLPTILRV